MDTLLGTPEIEPMYGWYYYPMTRQYKFWWVNQLLVEVGEEMLDIMPDYLAIEIRASAMVKPELTD